MKTTCLSRAVVSLLGCVFFLCPFTGWTAGFQTVTGRTPAVVRTLSPAGRMAGTNRLSLAIGLPMRNPAALTNLLQRIYDPASPQYHHYLTPAQFAEQFGPAETDYQAVIAFAKANGLQVTGTHSNRLLVDVSGSVAAVERALHVTLHTYRHPVENRTFYAPDTEPTLALGTPVLQISGLDNYALPHPRLVAHPLVSGAAAEPDLGSGPGGGYMGNDFRAAYLPGVTLNGGGQTVGLLQFDGYTASDISYYENLAGLPAVPLSNVLLDGFGGNPTHTGGEVEVSLDIEMAVSMATNLAGIIVYEAGPYGNWHDILNRMANDNLAKQMSCSWYIPGGAADPVADLIFQQMAAQGQTFFAASGDADAYSGLIPFPGDTPYITEVGGTTLTTSGPGGAWAAETVWNWGDGIGSGGGISTQYGIPAWQTNLSMTANQGSTTMRNTPDVALTADNVYVRANGINYSVGGTSCASPLWAGFAALVNQQAAIANRPAIGFINPALDAIGTGANYAPAFHDINTGNNESPASPAKFSATAGYDLCTGWGSPAGPSLINALANPEPLVIAPLTGFAALGGAGGPFTLTGQTLTLTNLGTNALSWTVGTTSVWLNVSTTGGTLAAAGGPGATITVNLNAAASNLVVGAYSATVWFTNVSDGVGQTRTFTLSVISPPAIATQPGGVAVLEGATAAFTTAATGGQPLAYQWQFDGTNLTDGGGITGSATTNLVITGVTTNEVGAYSVVVSNFAGVAVSSNAWLTLTPSLPVIVQQPANSAAIVGQTATFSVAVIGTSPYSYQWFFDSTNLSGATNASLTLSDVQLAQAGSYSVTVTNLDGSATSSNAALSVYLVPFINGFSPASGTAGAVVTITGSNFDPTSTNDIVHFGGVAAAVLAASSTNLTVILPAGALFAPVTVTVNGLTAYSSQPFIPTFNGAAQIGTNTLGGQINLPTPNGPGQVVIADLDGDGKPDLIVSEGYSAKISIYQNISTNGTLAAGSFGPRVDFPMLAGTYLNPYTVAVADLDGDGRLDLIAVNADSDVVSILRNISTPGTLTTNSFAARVDLPSGLSMRGVAVRDLNGDGRPEIVTANYGASTISIFQNGSTPGNLVFSNQVVLAAGNGAVNVAIADLDGDGMPDLVVPNYGAGTLSLFRNLMIAGNVITTNSFATRVDLPGLSQPYPIALGDMDGDGKLDLVLGGGNGSKAVAVYRNISSVGSLTTNSFAPAVPFAAAGWVNTLALGDLDGDGKIDIALASQSANAFSIFKNTATPGGFTTNSLAARVDYAAGSNPNGVAIGDLDGDGRADIVFANTYGNNLSVCQNLTVYPQPPAIIQQPASESVFEGQTAQFSVSVSGPSPLWYQWSFGGTNLLNATNAVLTLAGVQFAQAGTYAVLVTNLYGSVLSSNATLTVNPPVPPAFTLQPADQTVYAGSNASFSVTVTGSAPFAYQWSFNGTNLAAATNPVLSLTGVQFAQAGVYSVLVTNYGGSLQSSNAMLTVLAVPPAITQQPASQTVYAGNTAVFMAAASGTAPLAYQWEFNGTNVSGATNATLTLGNVQISQAGAYALLVTNLGGATLSSNALLTVATSTVPMIAGFSPGSGAPGASMTIAGVNFSPVTASNLVRFGAVTAAVQTASTTNLTVTVPAGAVFAPITVTVGGLTAYADQPFVATFPGVGQINSGSLGTQLNLPTLSSPGQVVIADLDGDGKPDLIIAEGGGGALSIYRNISTNGTLAAGSFASRVDLPMPAGNGFNPFTVLVADLDGDGRLDLVAINTDSNLVSVFRNLSSPGSLTTNSFATRLDLPSGSGMRGAAVQDLNGDGKPEIVTANYGDSTLSIFQNGSSPGNLVFSNRVVLPAGSGAVNVAIGDLDGDGRPDLVVPNYNGGTLSLFYNMTSTGGVITTNSFAAPVALPGLSDPYPIALGDLDGDGKLDLVLGGGNGSAAVAVYRNISTVGSLTTNSFAPAVTFAAAGWVNTLALQDLDGDGKIDIALASQFGDAFSIFKNTSTPGSFTANSLAARVDYAAGSNPNGVAIGDLDGDGRADIVFVNNYNNNLSIYQNLVPFAQPPTITQTPTNQTVFAGGTVQFGVIAGGSAPLAYQWSFDGTNLLNATNAVLTLAAVQLAQGGNYAVLVTNLYGSILSSNAVLTVNPPVPPTISAQPGNQTVYVGSNTSFSVTAAGTPPLVYQWNCNGTNLAGATNALLNLANVTLAQAGNYSVLVTNYGGSLQSSNATLTVLAVPPAITQQPVSQTVFAGNTALFTAAASGTAPLAYQWEVNGTNVSGATNATLTLANVQMAQAGNYALLVTNLGGTMLSSNALLTVLPSQTVPVISGFSPGSAVLGATIAIAGTNFSPVTASNLVRFGAVTAPVLTASVTNLTVTVPAGAVFAPITVTVGGLTAYAAQPFVATFSGQGQITNSSLATQVTLPTLSSPGQVVIADLDGDGKPDLIIAEAGATALSIYRNISTNGTLAAGSFASRVDLPMPSGSGNNPYTVLVADLDGDGRLDLIAINTDSALVSVFRNLSSPGSLTTNSFATRIDLPSGSGMRGAAVRDLNGDGRPDIVTANYGASTLSVFQNNSTPGNITFSSQVVLPAGSGAVNVAIGDLDGDGMPDLVVPNYGAGTLSVFRNLLTAGGAITTNSFAARVDLPGLNQPYPIALGDMDGDGKLDLVLGGGNGSSAVAVYRNTATVGSLATNSFAPAVKYAAAGWVNSLALGDLDGDGKIDIALASQAANDFSIFKNTSTPGSFTNSSLAARVDYAAGSNPNGVAIGDLDGDGRADIVFANTYSTTISLYHNVVPFAQPPTISLQPTNQTVAVNGTAAFSVTAGGTAPLTYHWQFHGTNLPGATNTLLTLTNVAFAQAGNYAVLVTNLYGSSLSSNALLTVNDRLDHFVWNTIPATRFVNTPFAVTVLAEDPTNGLFTGFAGTVTLRATNGVAVSPAVSGSFSQGTWTGTVTVAQTAVNLVLQASNSPTATGLANPISVVSLPVLSSAASAGTLYLLWPASPAGFNLKTTASLAPANWVPATGTALLIDGQYLLPVPVTGTNAYFRLQYSGQ